MLKCIHRLVDRTLSNAVLLLGPVAFFDHSGEHGIRASRWRPNAISWASDGDDFEVTGIGSFSCLGAELHPMRSNRVAGMSIVRFMVMP